MTTRGPESDYVLGTADAEHERLIRQARWVNPHTERVFCNAGICAGQRVLDLGSGVGDVALVLGRIVGPTGEVVGVERDARSIARARARVADAGMKNVRFTESDVSELAVDRPFDAAVGRYILMFLPDPLAVLRSVAKCVRRGGVIAFQEADWQALMRYVPRFPLWFAGASMMVETFRRSGTNVDMGPQLSQVFLDAGLPTPTICSDVLVGAEEWMPAVLYSIRSRMRELGLPIETLGDFDSLIERLGAEVAAASAPTPLPSLASAWCRKE